MMDFEFDLAKSASNKQKHGIDFNEAKALWSDEERLQIQAKSDTESRYALIATYRGKLWTAFYTLREERIRLISVRRARKGEVQLYDES